jgi:hypothetical protein
MATLPTTPTPSTHSTAMPDQATPTVTATLPATPTTSSAAKDNQLDSGAMTALADATQANTTTARDRVSSDIV